MTKNTKIVLLVAMGAVVLLVLAFLARDLYLRKPGEVRCDDGPRQTIDIRDFVIEYTGYSAQFEATVGEKAKFSGKLEPVALRQLTESLQQATEFRKFVVAGYNSCAIAREQFARFGATYQALDGVARQIGGLADKAELTPQEQARLEDLVREYVELTKQLAR